MKPFVIPCLLNVFLAMGAAQASESPGRIPVLYCTDLFHPHDDPDDHFDLAALYAIPEIEIRGIVLDQGAKQERKPGRIPVEQLNALTGRDIPWAIGLSAELKQPSDKGLDEPEKYQAGVNLILKVLQESRDRVLIVAVGSLRDLAAALNRNPALFAAKVSKLVIFIGDAQGAFREYNVGLDPKAYARVMNSGLPIYWVPCFDGGLWKNKGNASYWQAPHAELLKDASSPVWNYFIYALLVRNVPDPTKFLQENRPEAERTQVQQMKPRNLWSAAVFPFVAGRKYVIRKERTLSVPESDLRPDDKVVDLFTFQPVRVKVDPDGRESFADLQGSPEVLRFHITDPQRFPEAMTSVTRDLIKELGTTIAH